MNLGWFALNGDATRRSDKSSEFGRETMMDDGVSRCHSDEFKQNEPVNDRKEIVKWEFEMMFYDVILAI